jgi:hypothetical protein
LDKRLLSVKPHEAVRSRSHQTGAEAAIAVAFDVDLALDPVAMAESGSYAQDD